MFTKKKLKKDRVKKKDPTLQKDLGQKINIRIKKYNPPVK